MGTGQGTGDFDALPTEIADSDLLVVARDNVLYSSTVLNMPNGFTARKQVVPPLVGDFPTRVNALGYYDVTQLDDGIRMFSDRRAGDQVGGWVRSLPGGSWDVQMAFTKGFRHGNTQGGILLRESGTGKLMYQSFGVSTVPGWFTARWSSPTSFGAIVTNRDERGMGTMWQRFTLNGANIEMRISVDGLAWKDMGSVATTTPFTTAPDQWGFCMNNGSQFNVYLDAIDWDE